MNNGKMLVWCDLCLPDAQSKLIRLVPDHGMDCEWDKMFEDPIVILFENIHIHLIMWVKSRCASNAIANANAIIRHSIHPSNSIQMFVNRNEGFLLPRPKWIVCVCELTYPHRLRTLMASVVKQYQSAALNWLVALWKLLRRRVVRPNVGKLCPHNLVFAIDCWHLDQHRRCRQRRHHHCHSTNLWQSYLGYQSIVGDEAEVVMIVLSKFF